MAVLEIDGLIASEGLGGIPLGQELDREIEGANLSLLEQYGIPAFESLCETDGLPAEAAFLRRLYVLTARLQYSRTYGVTALVQSIQIPSRRAIIDRPQGEHVNAEVISLVRPQDGDFKDLILGDYHRRYSPDESTALEPEHIARFGHLYGFVIEDTLNTTPRKPSFHPQDRSSSLVSVL